MRYAILFILILFINIQQLLGSGEGGVVLPAAQLKRLAEEGVDVIEVYVVNAGKTTVNNEVNVQASVSAVATSNVSGGSWSWNRKYSFIVGSVVVSYGYMVYLLKSMESYLEEEGLWSNWRKGLSLSGLYSIEDTIMVEDLILAIQIHYAGFRYAEEYKNPIKSFLNDVKKERVALQRYEGFAKIIKNLPFFLSKIFFLNQELLDSTSERKQRLDYFSSKIIHWMTKKKHRNIL